MTRTTAAVLLGIGQLVVAACTVAREPGPAAAESVTTPTDPSPRSITDSPSAEVLREQRAYTNTEPIPRIQRRFGIAPTILEPGSYRFDALGRDVELELTSDWRLDVETPGTFVLTRPNAELQALLPVVGFHRPIGMAQPARVGTDSISPGSSGWEDFDRWDIDSWIDAVSQLVVLDEGTLDVDGQSVRWWDLDVDPTLGPTFSGCQPGTCIAAFWTGSETYTVARDLERIRWYEIGDPHGPIVVFVAAREPEFEDLVADVDALLAAARLGDPAPHPLHAGVAQATQMLLAANQSWTFTGVPGVRFQSPSWVPVLQRPGAVWFGQIESNVGILRPVASATGAAIISAVDLVDALREGGGEIVEEDAQILGLSAVVVDLDLPDPPDGIVLLTDPVDGLDPALAIWPAQRHHRVWVVEGSTGPMMIAAAGVSASHLDDAIDSVLPWVLDGLELCPATDSCSAGR